MGTGTCEGSQKRGNPMVRGCGIPFLKKKRAKMKRIADTWRSTGENHKLSGGPDGQWILGLESGVEEGGGLFGGGRAPGGERGPFKLFPSGKKVTRQIFVWANML